MTREQLILSLSIWDVKFLPEHEQRLVIRVKRRLHPPPPPQAQEADVRALSNGGDTSRACSHKDISILTTPPPLLECDGPRAGVVGKKVITELVRRRLLAKLQEDL